MSKLKCLSKPVLFNSGAQTPREKFVLDYGQGNVDSDSYLRLSSYCPSWSDEDLKTMLSAAAPNELDNIFVPLKEGAMDIDFNSPIISGSEKAGIDLVGFAEFISYVNREACLSYRSVEVPYLDKDLKGQKAAFRYGYTESISSESLNATTGRLAPLLTSGERVFPVASCRHLKRGKNPFWTGMGVSPLRERGHFLKLDSQGAGTKVFIFGKLNGPGEFKALLSENCKLIGFRRNYSVQAQQGRRVPVCYTLFSKRADDVTRVYCLVDFKIGQHLKYLEWELPVEDSFQVQRGGYRAVFDRFLANPHFKGQLDFSGLYKKNSAKRKGEAGKGKRRRGRGRNRRGAANTH